MIVAEPEHLAAAEGPSRPAASAVSVRRCGHGADGPGLDWVAEETPVALEYNGIAHAVMLASPVALEDFAIGFSLSEGIVTAPRELLDLEVEPAAEGVRIAMRLTGAAFARLKGRRRGLEGRTGCGLCGVERLEQVRRPLPALRVAARIDVQDIMVAMNHFDECQDLRSLTGATHAAAWLPVGQAPTLLREDVGRHNALDKLIGALARARVDTAQGAVLLTCRASFEMVQKAAAVGIGSVVARSAPTALAVRCAQALGLSLVGFARRGRLVVYSHGERLSGCDDK